MLVDPMLATGGSAASALRSSRSAARSGCASSASSPRPRGSRRSAPSTPRCPCSAPRSTGSSTSAATSGPGSATPATASTARTEGSAARRRSAARLGESRDARHAGEIDLGSWSWGSQTRRQTRRARAAGQHVRRAGIGEVSPSVRSGASRWPRAASSTQARTFATPARRARGRRRRRPATSAISTPSGQNELPVSAAAGRGSGAGAAPIRPDAGSARWPAASFVTTVTIVRRHLHPHAVRAAQRAPLGYGGDVEALRVTPAGVDDDAEVVERRRGRRGARRAAVDEYLAVPAVVDGRAAVGAAHLRLLDLLGHRRRGGGEGEGGDSRQDECALHGGLPSHRTERAISSARDLVTSASRRSVRSPRRQTRVGPASRDRRLPDRAGGVLVDQAVDVAAQPEARLPVDADALDRRPRPRQLADELRSWCDRGTATAGRRRPSARTPAARGAGGRGVSPGRRRRTPRRGGRAHPVRASPLVSVVRSPRSSGEVVGAGVGAFGTRSIFTPSIPSQRSTALRAEGTAATPPTASASSASGTASAGRSRHARRGGSDSTRARTRARCPARAAGRRARRDPPAGISMRSLIAPPRAARALATAGT